MSLVTRREWLGGMAVTSATAPASGTQPNVIVIVMDDLGCHDLGYLGATDLKTPHIDAVANSGARFSNWYSNAPVCAPARASILTGRFPSNAGVPTNGRSLVGDAPTLGTVLKAGGYDTAAFGKWHLGSDDATCPNARGFDYFYGFHSGCVDFYSHRYYWGEPGVVNYHDLWRNRQEIFEDGAYLTERITEEATTWMARKRGGPFMAYVAYNAPHYPMHAPKAYLQRFSGLAPERQVYAAMIAAVDDGIGSIRRTLEQTGQWNNTLLFLLGDNGATTEKRAGVNQNYATAGDNGVFRGFKFSLFDGGHHVPGLMRWPHKIPSQLNTEPVMSMDILPTACRAAGVSVPAHVDGSEILSVVMSGARSPHESLFWSQGDQTAIRQGRWKLVSNGRDFGRSSEGGKALAGEDSVWLSDLATDPGERRNLRRFHPELVDQLLTRLERWKKTLR